MSRLIETACRTQASLLPDRLELESGLNIELEWFLGRLATTLKTITDFRKNRGKGFKNTCSGIIGFCRPLIYSPM